MKSIRYKSHFWLGKSLDKCFARSQKRWKSTQIVQRHEPIYNTKYLMQNCARSGDFIKAFSLIDQMKTEGISPGLRSYNNVITACVNGQRLDKAFEVLNQIKNDNLIPDTIVYTNLIHGCVVMKDYQRAWQVFDFLRKKNLMEPDQVTYTTMIHASAKMQQTEKALNLFEEMQQRGLFPTEVTFNALIYACAQRRDFYDDAKKLIHQMKEYGYPPDMITMNTLLNAAEINGDVETATSLIKLMESSDSFQPDIISYTSLLNTLARAHRHPAFQTLGEGFIQKAEQVFAELSVKNIQPTLKTLNSFLSVYAEGFRVKRAAQVFKEIFAKHQMEPNEHSYNIMIKMYGHTRKLPEALKLFFEMKKKGIQPTETTFTYLLSPCGTAEFVDAGVKIVTLMVNHGFTPTGHLLSPLISQYNQQGLYHESDKLRQLMHVKLKKPLLEK